MSLQTTPRLFFFPLMLLLAVCAVSVRAQKIELVSHLDPVPGTEYADIWGEGDYAYLASWQGGEGVFIVDVSDPDNPEHVFTYPGGDFADVKVADGIGYFASRGGGLGVHIVDLSDPTAPQLLSDITSDDGGFDNLHNIAVWGDFLYETHESYSDVYVFDISTPTAPEFVRVIDTQVNIHDMTAIDDRLYTSGWNGKTEIFDVSQMSLVQAPTLLGTIDSGGSSHSNWPTADHNVLATARECNRCGVSLWDISDPANAVLLSRIRSRDFPGGGSQSVPHNPLIMGDFLYVSWYHNGVQVFDISDPTNPIHVGGYDTCQGCGVGIIGNWGVYPFLGTNRVLLSDMVTGLYVVDVSAVPEPATGVICCLCVAALATSQRRLDKSKETILKRHSSRPG